MGSSAFHPALVSPQSTPPKATVQGGRTEWVNLTTGLSGLNRFRLSINLRIPGKIGPFPSGTIFLLPNAVIIVCSPIH